MIIGKINTFDVPEGEYRMRVTSSVVGRNSKGVERLRIVGDLVSLKSRSHNYQAGIDYRSGSTDVLTDLFTIAGTDVDKIVSEEGLILDEGLSLLVGKECDVRIVHVRNGSHRQPYCKVSSVFRPGYFGPIV